MNKFFIKRVVNPSSGLRMTKIVIVGMVLFLFPFAVSAARLVKTADDSAVYYVDDEGVRHVYPNFKVFGSWYNETLRHAQGDVEVEIISDEELAGMELGQNVTFRPGSLIKVPSAPKVYAVEPGGILRPIISEQVAIDLYGNNWAKRVVDLPEVFFFDYKIDKNVRGRADLPDGSLVTLENSTGFYWMDKGVLMKFVSEEAVKDNGLNVDRVSHIPPIFPVRSRVISSLEKRIREPLWNIPIDAMDCEVESLRAVVLYLTNTPPTPPSKGGDSSGVVDDLDKWRSTMKTQWEKKTDFMSLIEIDQVVTGTYEDRYFVEGEFDVQEVARTFYDTHSDDYDFLFIWNSQHPVEAEEIADFWPVTNAAGGLGKPLIDRQELFGSRGKLKGVINMGRPGDYPLGSIKGMGRAVETALHELLHQWSGEADFTNETGINRTALQTDDGFHWSSLVDFISPLGGWGWDETMEGMFTSSMSQLSVQELEDLQFPDLDLYLMGLVPRHSVAPIHYFAPGDSTAQIKETMSGTKREVTIDDIVFGNGVRRCTTG